ncbi:unnamed protein product (macronuclear) [Paramecium tetraurelia]|uniref:Uncharacterized protein n=1 Tax=Paramecium tetraurelia TaxID=5888 RepID=A0DQH4_PARTE|nr:uncharacterized protein GSPATT00002691001 [Paramecium tetraurelia]CAK85291.1 unnamed protein product [Paramecium tetraurelia]|eukprot:XP_001452688.1 hypothetical protein (macronuclear) [Paramecium tetraurelia strain d4-2]
METQEKYFYYTWRDKPKQSQLCQNDKKVNVLCQISESLLQSQQTQSDQKHLAFWQLKRKNSIVEQNSQSQINTTRIQTRRNSVVTGQESQIKTSRKTHQTNKSQIENELTKKKKIRGSYIDEQSRRRLSRFLSNYEICNILHKRSLSRQDNQIYVEDIDKEMVTAQIKSIQNQQIRFQFHQSNKQIIQEKKYDNQINDMINMKQSTFKSVFQQIQRLTNEQRKKRVPVTQHKMLKSRTKLINCSHKIRERFQKILKQVLFVAKYKCRVDFWFEYPIKYNNQFYESIIEGNQDGIILILSKDPYLIHSRNKDGQTPLHIACICNNALLVKLFIKNGSNIEALDNKQLSPLYYSFKSNSNDCFKILLNSKAKPWSPPGGKLDQYQMNVVQKNLLMHARLIYIFTIWKIKK